MKFLYLFLVIQTLGTLAWAKLAPTSFTQFISETELIVEASPIKIERSGFIGGSAVLKVLRVVYGPYDKSEIQITWSDEEHDQPVSNLDQDVLLFLKKTKDGYQGAVYGRSYWPFINRVTHPGKADLDGPNRGFLYEYPLTMITLTSAEKKSLFAPSDFANEKKPFISMKKLKDLILKKKSK